MFVHSGLIEAVGGNRAAVQFAVGHEVGHALGAIWGRGWR